MAWARLRTETGATLISDGGIVACWKGGRDECTTARNKFSEIVLGGKQSVDFGHRGRRSGAGLLWSWCAGCFVESNSNSTNRTDADSDICHTAGAGNLHTHPNRHTSPTNEHANTNRYPHTDPNPFARSSVVHDEQGDQYSRRSGGRLSRHWRHPRGEDGGGNRPKLSTERGLVAHW